MGSIREAPKRTISVSAPFGHGTFCVYVHARLVTAFGTPSTSARVSFTPALSVATTDTGTVPDFHPPETSAPAGDTDGAHQSASVMNDCQICIMPVVAAFEQLPSLAPQRVAATMAFALCVA